MLTTVVVVVAAAFGWVVLSTLWLWRHQERIIFQPPATAPRAPAPARRVEFAAADGHPIFGYLVSPNGGHREEGPVVIAFHGNADLAAWQVPWAFELAGRSGVPVLLAEYRGYGGIPGRPTYETASSDARGTLGFARAVLGATRVILFGHSLGSAVATELARAMEPESPGALVLQSPFTSARAMAARMFVPPIPWIWRRVSRARYDTRRVVARLDCPVWVAHGSRDLFIPVGMGRRVFAAARRRGALLVVDGAAHNDVADVGGTRYWDWLVAAVRAGASAPAGELEEEGDRRLP